MRRVVDFEPDTTASLRPGHEVWIARLECGHGQHIRHQPPLHAAPWVTDAVERASRLGMELACRACRMPSLPKHARLLRRTPSWTNDEVPQALLRTHDLRAGRWGRLVVEEGRVCYVLDDVVPTERFHLKPGLPGIIEPERPHHIELQGEIRIYIEFFAAGDDS